MNSKAIMVMVFFLMIPASSALILKTGDINITYQTGGGNCSGKDCDIGWGNLTGVPAGFADGIDDSSGSVNGTPINISKLIIPTLTSCDTINTTADGTFECGNDGGGSETDPIYSASNASLIDLVNITNWNSAYGWGDHGLQGYITGYTETDPIYSVGITDYWNMSRINLGWANLTDYPSACGAGDFVTTIGDTLICDTPSYTVDTTTGNCTLSNSCPLITYDTELSYIGNCTAANSCGLITYDEELAYIGNCTAEGSCGLITYDSELSYVGNCSGNQSCSLVVYEDDVIDCSKINFSGTVGAAGICDGDNAEGAGSYDLNFTTDSGTEVILNTEVFSVVGAGEVSTAASGNEITITGTAHTVDTIWALINRWFFNNSDSLDFNETLLNSTIDARDTDTTYTAGWGLDLTGTTFSLNDSSSQASVDNSGRTYIQDVTLDAGGRVVGLASATETLVDTNDTIRVDDLETNLADVNTTANIEALNFVQGSHTVDTTIGNCTTANSCGLITYDSELAYIGNCTAEGSCGLITYDTETTGFLQNSTKHEVTTLNATTDVYIGSWKVSEIGGNLVFAKT